MAIAKINGRSVFLNCNTVKVEPVSNGRWQVIYDRVEHDDGEVVSEGHTFLVVGGKNSGGRSNEWFCHHPKFYGDQWLPCGSMVEAVKMGVQY